MPSLQERMADLADDVVDVVPPGDLWAAERHRMVVVRRSTLLVAAVTLALVGLLLGGAWRAAQPPPPAAPRGEVGLPDRLFTPSPWLPTAQGGELGRLVALVSAEQGTWWRGRPGVVGVSALTGEYAFLDLPNMADEPVALAPDGRHVAFWTVGTPSGSPTVDPSGPITGLSVYDAATGAVQHVEVPTEHGLEVGEGMFFADANTLVISLGQILGGVGDPDMHQSSSRSMPTLVWRLGAAAPTPEEWDQRVDAMVPFVAARDGVVWADGRLVRAGTPPAVRAARIGPGLVASHQTPVVALGPDARRIARVGGAGLSGRSPNRVTVWSVREGSDACCTRGVVVPGSRGTFGVVSWLDDEHLAVMQGPLTDGGYQVTLNSLDRATGEAALLVELDGPPSGDLLAWQFAADLLTAPSVTGQKPPEPWDPRLVAAGVGCLLVAAVVALWRVRRRRVAR